MKSFLFYSSFFILLFHAAISHGQADYFQQNAAYNIVADLDVVGNTLTGKVEIVYTNNAPVSLSEIYIHLWANAFKKKNSFLGEASLMRGNRHFYFADEKELGGFTDLTIMLDGKNVGLTYPDPYEDYVQIILPEKLETGNQVTIEIPFTLKVPFVFSRLGHKGPTYHFTHWYPRVAVYDNEGWHPMHYRMIGEFYGEYGDYNVSLTVPSDYTLGFTGVDKNPEEIKVVAQKAGRQTYEISATGVHDFAWVASNVYMEENDQLEIDGHMVEIKVLRRDGYKPHWKDAMDLTKEYLKKYSNDIGPYPYPSLTLVQDLPKGHANMEYPGLIIVGDSGNKKSLEYYINHELGHQWFFAALGFNERDEAWLDEGLTTFYEHRYTQDKYGIDHYTDQLPGMVKTSKEDPIIPTALIHQIKRRFDQRADTNIEDLSSVNYGFRFYERAASVYRYLEEYIGIDVFDRAMQNFYKTWNGKHPKTKDLQNVFVAELKSSGVDDDLEWFFNPLLLGTERMDFAIKGIRKTAGEEFILLENKSDFELPMLLYGYRKDQVVTTQWIPKFSGEKEFKLRVLTHVDRYSIDGPNLLFDVNRSNNHLKTKGLLKKMEPLSIGLPLRTDPSDRTNIFVTPVLGYNTTDGLQLGLGIFNTTFPTKSFKYFIAPKYSLNSKEVVGLAWGSYNQYFRSEKFRKLEYKLNLKRYNDFRDIASIDFESYLRIEPSVTLHFKSDVNSRKYSKLRLRTVQIKHENPTIDGQAWTRVNELKYFRYNFSALSPYNMSLALEQQSYDVTLDPTQKNTEDYLKLTAVWNQKYYVSAKKKVNLRFYGSHFLKNSRAESASFNNVFTHGSITLINQGQNDYLYDESFFNRDENVNNVNRFFTNQVSTRGGGFKTATANANSNNSNIGASNKWAYALNISTDLPGKLPAYLPIQPFFDLGYYSFKGAGNDPSQNKVIYSGGVMLNYELVQIYFPLFQSSGISDLYEEKGLNLFQKISFSINLQEYNPYELMDDFNF